MTPQDNAHTAFMLVHAAGRLPPAESLLADLHRGETGVNEKGDPTFALQGLRRQTRAAGVEPCVCRVATERGRPIQAPLGLFGIGVGKLEERL